ncbi:ABC-F family ATP-binding cassette domain-containing protein [Mycolicibacterium austroafricanum]|uniref:ABC-F family ATP-binding cassette domain-containing protein n=1 Tax=Mycolicibacterium austroafricanum TaxID=39687 RepID=A0ABT8HE39_MYCAO|nr:MULTISPECIES: ABC-F family ATP-binding cassette domain-containing protein [Mycolicibacterium]MDN4519026.1 ABC-F family ATP-binding cassette domain-containing protein [Mycolicibacterium austroafricanum]MDW5613338.1 ABC-F family ATP-binding cassette domain-containing protein [Mycolicibacterium sp. D5.8-2]PQP50046.1 ABC transporter ATP-binding protein [Mycolicibacterium austroafricanum]QRZ04473.1 ABC-F family ATP-binding cassette domain-containing protein [Mycolicibacterium austroafricanum]QZT
MAHLLGGENLHLEYPTGVVFDSVTVGVSEGDRIGIVGRNGDGKSTLLGLLTGRIAPHSGRVTRRGGLRVGSVDQADTLDPDRTVGWSLVGDRPDHEWAGDARIRDVIGGLVADIPFGALVGTLSGGQRRRVQLAALLIDDWDVIALDEPTNHLDIQGITWLAEHLKQRWARGSGGLLVVTHDRWFLDEVATTTWEVHPAGSRVPGSVVEPFEGGYAAYVLQRVERDRQAAAVEAKRQNLMRKELAWLRRGPPARTSKPKFRIDAANALISDVPPLRNNVELSRAAMARLGKDVIDLLDVSVSYPGGADGSSHGREVLRDIEWRIAPGERTGILGANGAGKSTLLGLIAGTVTPTSGRVKRGKTVRLAVLDQESRELEPLAGDMVREVLARLQTTYQIDGKDVTPAQLLERLGFAREHLSARVGELSGGQRRRLQLMLVLLSEPNVLVLDEPTNDVDTDMLTATEDLLDSWPGTLIVVSHDRYLLERITDQQYAILDGRLRHLPGGIDEYLRLAGERPEPSVSRPKPAAAEQLSGAELRNIEKEITSIDRSLAKLADRISAKHDEMARHDQSDHVGLGRLNEQLRELEGQVAEQESRWLELSERLES